MAQQKDIQTNSGFAKMGMDKDSHPSQLKEIQYTHALNANTENESGNGLNLTNEKSNILSSKFKEGFKVHGFENDIDSNSTFFFLINPTTGVGEFGIIENNQDTNDLVDQMVQCTDCDNMNILSTPLEEITQEPLQTYDTKISDACKSSPELGFNFNINYPIKKIVIKNEKSGKIIYFSDGYNPPRNINFTNLQDYFIQEVPCDTDLPISCIDFDELRIFKLYKFPTITPASIELGGRLRMGVYEFLLAYCDASGNEISPYYSITQPVSIFDKNNRIQEQQDTADRTNFSIRLDVSNLDKRYSHYKVAVIQTADIEGATRYFIEGIHTINDTTVVYTTEQNKVPTSIDKLLEDRIHVEKVEGMTASNNILFQYGITRKKELNLQPVVNFMGQFLKWQTSIAPENLYDNGVNSSKFLGYNRDEVVPFSVRFLLDGGYETSLFPFAGRVATVDDLAEVVDIVDGEFQAKPGDTFKDVDSILKNIIDCNSTSRTKKWQYYNTAKLDTIAPTCQGSGIKTVEVIEPVTKTCITESIAIIPAGTLSINVDEQGYTNLQDYLESHKIDCPYAFVGTDICDYLQADYSTVMCQENVFQDLSCTDIVESSEVYIGSVNGAVDTFIEKVFPTEYIKIISPESCDIYTRNAKTVAEDPDYIQDSTNPLGYQTGDPGAPVPVYKRNSSFTNESCSYAGDIALVQNFSSNNNSKYFGNYYVNSTLNNLLTSKSSTITNSDFNIKIHKGALWFKGTTDNKNGFIVDISQATAAVLKDSIPTSNTVRVSVFKSCSDTTAIYSEYVTVAQGELLKFEKDSTIPTTLKITNSAGTVTTIINGWFSAGNFLLAIDTPIGTQQIDTDPSGVDTSTTVYIVKPTNSCYTVTKRNIEYSRIDVSWDSIELNKKFNYTALCTFDQPVVQSCTAVPYKKGNFSYWESTETYPDNTELFDSRNLTILTSDIPPSIKSEFEDIFTDATTDGKYVLNDNANLTCKPIRHFKFPDNKVAPFMTEATNKLPFGSSLIYPLGVTIDENIINTFLDIAVYNNLISQSDRDKVTGYEIFRGDTSLDRSVVASGMLFDMRKYKENNKKVYYSNYPFNSYSPDYMNLDEDTTTDGEYGVSFGDSGRNFTFHSPETDYYKPSLPSELSIQGYIFGNSRGHFDEVKDHPRWVILSPKAYSLADILAGLQVTAEAVIKISEIAAAGSSSYGSGYWGGWVFGVYQNIPGGIISTAATVAAGILETASAIVFNYGKYRYEWLKIFRDLGSPNNFAYYYFGEGYYNYMQVPQTAGNSLRGLNISKYLKDGRHITTNEVTGEKLTINNIDRENSVLLSTGEVPLIYPSVYKDYDKGVSNSSLTYSSQAGLSEVGRSSEIIRNIASPYAAIKNYLPSQYGTLNSIKWLTTSHIGNLKFPTSSCISIFGGDTFIARHTLKRKQSLFMVTAMKQASLTPFNYFYYSNIGRNPKFYVSYEINKDFHTSGKTFPELASDFVFDNDNTSGNYYTPPSKFYLYYYGVPNFLVETRINTNHRYGGKETRRNYYPLVGDLGEWTQETNVSIREPNVFLYNNEYSKSVTESRKRTLPDTYKKTFFDKVQNMPNGIIASLPDKTENSLYDPWLIYRPLDSFEFPSNYGKLKDIIDIESQAILARFSDTSVLYNKVDTKIDTGGDISTKPLGGSSFFQRRSTSFHNTKLGYGGTQNFASISNEYGHFWVDAKRGQVLMMPSNGEGMVELSSMVGDKPSGMRNWFKEHLPFKILKHIKNVDVDNPYNGVGITMGWDSRHKRVFITKKDYIPTDTNVAFIEGRGFVLNSEEGVQDISLTSSYFKDVSWTVSYSPILNSWLSFYSYKPNYYINHNTYFQTGLNNTVDSSEFGLWSHLLTNKSYQVFYGKRHPFTIEYGIKDEYLTKTFYNVHLWVEARRYQNDYDYSSSLGITFNKAIVYNNVSCSGHLNLRAEPSRIARSKDYPKTNADNTQDIMITNSDRFKWSYNYFYNRVRNNTSNIPFILRDENQIEVSANPNIVSFKGKPVLERLTGNWFLNRITYDLDTRYSLIFKFTSSESEI